MVLFYYSSSSWLPILCVCFYLFVFGFFFGFHLNFKVDHRTCDAVKSAAIWLSLESWFVSCLRLPMPISDIICSIARSVSRNFFFSKLISNNCSVSRKWYSSAELGAAGSLQNDRDWWLLDDKCVRWFVPFEWLNRLLKMPFACEPKNAQFVVFFFSSCFGSFSFFFFFHFSYSVFFHTLWIWIWIIKSVRIWSWFSF